MCGLWASVGLDVTSRSIALVAHRGPDGEGWVEIEAPRPVRLGHALLAISGGGDCPQPVACPKRCAWLTYNGEVYNQESLRRTLVAYGYPSRGRADTWTVLDALHLWGRQALQHLHGMFAFVYFDRSRGYLLAGRDAFGIKPLYVLRHRGGIAFASELKQFLAVPDFRPRLQTHRAKDFLELGVTDHARETMWRDTYAVPPGGCVEVQMEQDGRLTIRESTWYRIPQPNGAPHAGDQLLSSLRAAVQSHASTEVPAAISLSGGLDSSTIACCAPTPMRCYSMTYDGGPADEIEHARVVADRRQTQLVPVRVAADELEPLTDEAVWHLDEPFPSLTVLAQSAVFRAAARDGVKVVLTGQGADELLGGYRFLQGPNLIGLARAGRWGALVKELAREHALGAAATALAPVGWLPRLVACGWGDPALARARMAVHRGGTRDNASNGLHAFRRDLLGPANLSMLLRYEDRTSMAHGIEARPPFLDHAVVETALRFHGTQLMLQGLNKVPLRRAITDLVPRAILNRREKQGFATPEAEWLRGPLRGYVLAKAQAAHERFPQLIGAAQLSQIHAALDARGPLGYPLWRTAVFGAWAERFGVE